MNIHRLLPDSEMLIGLEPEELAAYVLEALNWNSSENFHPGSLTSRDEFTEYPAEYREGIAQAVAEACLWLEHEGLIGPAPGPSSWSAGWKVVTRRGKRLKGQLDVEASRKADLLPK